MAGSSSPEPDLDACGSRLQAMGPEAVVITLGSRGCQVIASETWSVAAPRVDAVDTVGAGDAFNGALAAALAAGRDLHQAVPWATAAAALAVTKPGANRRCRFTTRSTSWRREPSAVRRHHRLGAKTIGRPLAPTLRQRQAAGVGVRPKVGPKGHDDELAGVELLTRPRPVFKPRMAATLLDYGAASCAQARIGSPHS